MVEMVRRPRSRKLGIYEFFQILQVEYLVADLRQRVYTRAKDKAYWQKVGEGKKATIENIASKNGLPTIFTDETMKADMEARVYRVKSYPNFHYKNEEDKVNQEYWDLMNYYSKDADVRFEYCGEVRVGKVKRYETYDTFMLIDMAGVDVKVPVQEVTRIL